MGVGKRAVGLDRASAGVGGERAPYHFDRVRAGRGRGRKRDLLLLGVEEAHDRLLGADGARSVLVHHLEGDRHDVVLVELERLGERLRVLGPVCSCMAWACDTGQRCARAVSLI